MDVVLNRIKVKVTASIRELDASVTEFDDTSLAHDRLIFILKDIRNRIIGNIDKKIYYLHENITPRLLVILKESPLIPAKSLACAILVSLASDIDVCIQKLDEFHVFKELLGMLHPSYDLDLIEILCKALAKISLLNIRDKSYLFDNDHSFLNFLHFSESIAFHPKADLIMANLTDTAANGCLTELHQQMLFESSLCKHVLSSMLLSTTLKAQESALNFIVVLTKNNNAGLVLKVLDCIGKNIKMNKSMQVTASIYEVALDLFLQFSKNGTPQIRFLALNCLVHFNLISHEKFTKSSNLWDVNGKIGLVSHILPSLVRLIEIDPSKENLLEIHLNNLVHIRESVPILFAYLLNQDDSLDRAMLELGAIKAIVNLLEASWNSSDPYNVQRDKVTENCLLALAAFSAKRDENRHAILQSKKAVSVLMSSLSMNNARSCLASCHCILSLSRSVAVMRRYLQDANIVEPLYALIDVVLDPKNSYFDILLDIQVTACGVLCNLLMSFSSMQESLLALGAVTRLAQLTLNQQEPSLYLKYLPLRRNSSWALKNVLFQSNSEIKKAVLDALTVKGILAILQDPDEPIQENGFALLRNLMSGQCEDITLVVEAFKNEDMDILTLLEMKLNDWIRIESPMSRYPHLNSSSYTSMRHILYTLANMATGNTLHKKVLMERVSLISCILAFLTPPHDPQAFPTDVQCIVASLWCIINLTWQEDPDSHQRVNILQSLGIESKLKVLLNYNPEQGLSTSTVPEQNATDNSNSNINSENTSVSMTHPTVSTANETVQGSNKGLAHAIGDWSEVRDRARTALSHFPGMKFE